MPRTREITGEAPPADPGEVHLHLALQWDEAQIGCTRVVEVDGRLEWLDIPNGAEDGQDLCFQGRGNFVPDDNRHGDLWVTLEVAPEPVPGSEVGLHLEISPIEALTGGRRTVEIQGRKVWVRIPPNASGGQVIRVAGEGGEGEHGGARGDLLIVLDVATSLPIPLMDGDVKPAHVGTQAVVPYSEPALAAAPRRSSGFGWALAAVAAAALSGGVALFFLPQLSGEAPADPGTQAPLPPISRSQPTAVAPMVVKPPAPEAVAPLESWPPVERARPVRRPGASRNARAVRAARARRAAAARTVRTPRQPRAHRAAATLVARTRFCGRCGRPIRSGSFCGNCGRKL